MAFKVHETGFLDKLGLNRQMLATEVNDAANTVVGGTYSSLESLYNNDGTGFQRAGMTLGDLSGNLIRGGLTAGFGFAIHKYAMAKGMFGLNGTGVAAKNWRGGIAAKMQDGTHSLAGWGGKGFKKPMNLNDIVSKGKEGVFIPKVKGSLAEGKFIKRPFMLGGWGAGLSMAAMFIAPMVASSAFSLAGRLLDESHSAYMESRYNHTDSRVFQNRETYLWNMQKQQAVMDNLVPYEQNTMSLSRIYHRR